MLLHIRQVATHIKKDKGNNKIREADVKKTANLRPSEQFTEETMN